jgi:hypothetical protein
MRPADRHYRCWVAALAALAALAAGLAFPVVTEAAGAPTPSSTPAPTSNLEACNNSTEFYIQFDIGTCISNAASSVASWVGDQAIQDVASWITTAAADGSAQLLSTLEQEAAHPTLNAPWFESVYFGGGSTPGQAGSRAPGSVVIAAWLMVLVVTGALMTGVIRGDLGGMLRLVAVRLPVAIFITYIAVSLVSALLALTDVASSWVLRGGIDSLQQWTAHLQGGDIGHDFLTVVACLALIVATLLGYLELLARDAAIYIVTAFIPLVAVASLWPGAHNALKRGAETLFVLCVSKFVLVFVLVLGATALASSTDLRSFAPLLTGTLIFLIAALAPWAIFRLIPILEVSAVPGLAGGASRFGMRASRSGRAAAGAGLSHLSAGVTAMRDHLAQDGASPTPSGEGGKSASQQPAEGLRVAGSAGRSAPDPGGEEPPAPSGNGRGPAPPGPGPRPDPETATRGPVPAGGSAEARGADPDGEAA